MKPWTLLAAAIMTLCGSLWANPAFEAANRAYDAKEFADARGQYEDLVKQGEWTPNLFYNLGNAEARLGNDGRAALNYERALALAPAHQDARANLEFLRKKTGAEMPEPRWFEIPLGLLGFNGWTAVAVAGGWLLAAAAFAPFVLKRRAGGGVWMLGILGALAAGAGAAGIWHARGEMDLAVVVVEKAVARMAPADLAAPAGDLPAGSRARWLVERSGWVECVLPSGTRAWVPDGSLERVRLSKP